MLRVLGIKNFALIEDISLEFTDHFSIITGETGAGKSIILGALSLLLGKRADLNSIKDSEKKCIIEGHFSIGSFNLSSLFEALDLDYEEHTIIRREILPSGKSRAFVNDTPVKLSNLSELGVHLIDIHSQHETLSIGNIDYQYSVLDTVAQNSKVKQDYKVNFKLLSEYKRHFEELKFNQVKADETYDYNVFLLSELKEAKLKTGLQEELESEQRKLSHIEELEEKLGQSFQHLDEESMGVISQLREVNLQMRKAAQLDTNLEELYRRVESILIEAEDISSETQSQLESLELDPKVLDQINTQLQHIYNLQKKHHVSNVEGLIETQNELEEQVSVKENAEQALREGQAKIDDQTEKLKAVAKSLFKSRQDTIKVISSSVESMLSDLGIPDAKFEVRGSYTSVFTPKGADEFEWVFSANKGSALQDLKKVASGGELSRITLAIKSLLAEFENLPTIVFDEIDTGVSGDIATKMGSIMKKMSSSLQVISITHLPQIAGMGEQHFKVYKTTENEKTRSNIKILKGQERVVELAEMLGGDKTSVSALAHAQSLLK
ncbi:DNA repair protein RecN [Psychroflexus gondwanensis]|uniref:DNA repair protein RecN n=1 Tax=Psychroflexus gondwanensis ACAM 44 TaxID=1189619 RepID=N1WS57_9FLAO|nr:DNA repair protein RecN [Psychroflexus gondwanensis]EMY81845.1 DNA repair protein RecN [Psychroflexus gondwanensis ACAM 44]TXE19842.1 DNA repair protein RecN [Psychroflexus gondwanensis]